MSWESLLNRGVLLESEGRRLSQEEEIAQLEHLVDTSSAVELAIENNLEPPHTEQASEQLSAWHGVGSEFGSRQPARGAAASPRAARADVLAPTASSRTTATTASARNTALVAADGKPRKGRSTSEGLSMLSRDDPPASLLGAEVQRPNLGGDPDNVTFGIFLKDVFSINLDVGTFACDIVLTYSWHDNRTVPYVPAGVNEITVPTEDAAKVIWMPDMTVTNRDKFDTVSSAVTLQTSGWVTKVERVMATIRNTFDISGFPYDSQFLKVRIASSALYSADLMVKPFDNSTFVGVHPQSFQDKDLNFISWSASSFIEEDASLSKSRGELSVHVKRNSLMYFYSMLLPEMFLVIMAWFSFFLPLEVGYTMPRVGTYLICFLSFLSFEDKIEATLPARGSVSWIDIFLETCSLVMFSMICFQVFVTTINAQMGLKEFAHQTNTELIAFYAVLIFVLWCCVFLNPTNALATKEGFVRGLFLIAVLAFAVLTVMRFIAHLRHEREKQGQPPQAEGRRRSNSPNVPQDRAPVDAMPGGRGPAAMPGGGHADINSTYY
jgi:hypothetical protein